jgi:Ca2+-binding EF-hand superfamily protein
MKSTRYLLAAAAALPFSLAFAQSPPTDPAPQSQTTKSVTFESLDTDNDGRISPAEAEASATVKAQFSRYDKDGNGFIERAEVMSANNSTDEAPAEPPKQP